MAVLVYRVRNDSLEYPYPRELVAVYANEKYREVHTFISKYNAARKNIWETSLSWERKEYLSVEEVKDRYPNIKVSPRLAIFSFKPSTEK